MRSRAKGWGQDGERQLARGEEVGVEDTPVNIRNKVARGGFSAVFFVQCLRAIGVSEIRF